MKPERKERLLLLIGGLLTLLLIVLIFTNGFKEERFLGHIRQLTDARQLDAAENEIIRYAQRYPVTEKLRVLWDKIEVLRYFEKNNLLAVGELVENDFRMKLMFPSEPELARDIQTAYRAELTEEERRMQLENEKRQAEIDAKGAFMGMTEGELAEGPLRETPYTVSVEEMLDDKANGQTVRVRHYHFESNSFGIEDVYLRNDQVIAINSDIPRPEPTPTVNVPRGKPYQPKGPAKDYWYADDFYEDFWDEFFDYDDAEAYFEDASAEGD